MDQDLRLLKTQSSSSLSVNAAIKSSSKKVEVLDASKSGVYCQVCDRRGHSALNCYNRLNVTWFPP